MTQIKVSTLTGPLLDYWVGKTQQGLRLSGGVWKVIISGSNRGAPYSPSTNWAHGGPIIEREGIRWQPTPLHKEAYYSWKNGENVCEEPLYGEYGSTLLEAAMRCFVASKFGEEVDE